MSTIEAPRSWVMFILWLQVPRNHITLYPKGIHIPVWETGIKLATTLKSDQHVPMTPFPKLLRPVFSTAFQIGNLFLAIFYYVFFVKSSEISYRTQVNSGITENQHKDFVLSIYWSTKMLILKIRDWRIVALSFLFPSSFPALGIMYKKYRSSHSDDSFI